MRTETFSTTVDEVLVSRVAGLPMSMLPKLRFERTAGLIASLLEKERTLQAQAERLSDALYRVIGQVREKQVRGDLMALRRAIYQGQMPKQRLLAASVRAALPAELADRLSCWLALREEITLQWKNGESLLTAEWQEKRGELRQLARQELFQQGLVLASKDLYADLMRWLHTDVADKPPADRRLELGLMTYLSRAATKTSPFSTFTSSGRGSWVESGPAYTSSRRWSRQSVVELSQVILQPLLSALARWPEIRALLPLQVNSSLTLENQSLCFLGRSGGEAVMRLSVSPTLQYILYLLRDGECSTYESLVQRLLVSDEQHSRADIVRFLDQLIEIGLINASPPIADQAIDHLAQLLTWLQSARSQRVERLISLLQDLHAALDQYPAREARERFQLLNTIVATLEQIYQELGLSQRGIQIPQKNVIYEDTLAALDVRCAREGWSKALDDLALIQQLSGLYTPSLSARLAATAFFVDQYGAGGSASLLHFYEAFCRERRQPGGWRPDHQVSGLHLIQMLEDLDAPAPVSLPELAQVFGLRKDISRWIAQQPLDDEGTCRLSRETLRSFIARFPPFIIPPPSLLFYCQILPRHTDPMFVLNAFHSGFGRSQARLQRLEQRIARLPLTVSGDNDRCNEEEPIWADLTGAFYSNANLRTSQTTYEIAYPGVVSARPPEGQLALTDLFITHDPAAHRLRLLSKRLKKEILPVHLGLMADFWLPPLCRFLLRAFSSGPSNPLMFTLRQFADNQPLPRYYPRLVIGQVLVERATWVIPATSLPRREKGTSAFHYMLSVRRWLDELALPQECFVRILSRTPIDLETWTRQVPSPSTMNKNRKPLYIDFANYFSLMMFEQLVEQTTWALLLQEVTPGLNDLVVTDGQASYASEYIVALTQRAEAI